jgi:3-deoxy-manno-octulosonate cytidylyltransferase (CMP-KDO synthetase)
LAVQILCVIPARLASTRIPHKPLQLIGGEPLIRRVAERALEAGVADRVVVASDDPRVVDAVSDLCVEGTLTDRAHQSGTERVAEVANRRENGAFEMVLSIQGDEPFFPVEGARGAVERVLAGDPIGTAAGPLLPDDLADSNRVKVVIDEGGKALRFSRRMPASGAWGCGVSVLHHIGIYAFRKPVLRQWMKWKPAPAELAERLEQLRPLHYGVAIGVSNIGEAAPVAVDTAGDLERAEAHFESLIQGAGR